MMDVFFLFSESCVHLSVEISEMSDRELLRLDLLILIISYLTEICILDLLLDLIHYL